MAANPTPELLRWTVAIATGPAEFAEAASAAGFHYDIASGIVMQEMGPQFTDPLPALLALPLRCCTESDFAFEPEDDLLLRLTIASRTAFTCDPGTAFTRALGGRSEIAAARQKDLRLCLHEAFANGVMHGNFEIFSGNVASPLEFVEQATLLERRLTDPRFNGRPIEVGARIEGDTLLVWVADSGDGFDTGRPMGRGLSLIGAKSDRFWHDAKGSKIVMEFHAKAGHGTGD